MLQAGKQLECLINEQVQAYFLIKVFIAGAKILTKSINQIKYLDCSSDLDICLRPTCQRGRVVVLIGELLAT